MRFNKTTSWGCAGKRVFSENIISVPSAVRCAFCRPFNPVSYDRNSSVQVRLVEIKHIFRPLFIITEDAVASARKTQFDVHRFIASGRCACRRNTGAVYTACTWTNATTDVQMERCEGGGGREKLPSPVNRNSNETDEYDLWIYVLSDQCRRLSWSEVSAALLFATRNPGADYWAAF